MLLFKKLSPFEDNHLLEIEKLGFIERLIVRVTKLRKSKNGFKVIYFEELLNFIRVLCLYVILENDLKFGFNKLEFFSNDDNSNRILKSLIDLLYQFEILILKNGKLVLNKKYELLLGEEKETIVKLFKQEQNPEHIQFEKGYFKLFNDFLFVKDLIKKYRKRNYEFSYINNGKELWNNMIDNGDLDYEVRLAETLFELSKLKIPNKIKSPFDEDYYTESGRNAFKNFTQYKFVDFFTKIANNRNHVNVLDIGCGYGNYIDVLHENFPQYNITGIEVQEKVQQYTSDKFKQFSNIEVIHGDIFNYQPTKKYDVILLNYVLFYFNKKEKATLLNRAGEILNDNGSIIICQYFSHIEKLKSDLASKQRELSVSKKIEMYYSNKILYANTLWNDSADTFSESVKWDEFIDIISESGFKINYITNADKFYYSLFIELKKQE